jgi:DNA mismatch repair protein MutS
MYSEYLKHYEEQVTKFGSKVAIFLMVGAFYEMYDVINPETGETRTSFSTLVDMLGLKISVKKGEGPGGLDGLVVGIPDYTVHKWAGRLTQEGWTVVLVDQVKNIQGKVVKRQIERILTPGTHVEAALASDIYISFVLLTESPLKESPFISVASVDLTTGHLHVFETQASGTFDAWTCNDIVQFMEIYRPREVLWSTNLLNITEQTLKNVLGCNSQTTFHRRPSLMTGAWLKPEFREEFLRERCNLKSLLPTHVALHLAPGSRSESALISLLHALKELWPSMSLGSLLVFPWAPGSMMRLGENALVQLHMIVMEQAKTDVLGILDKCSTPMGHRGLRERLLRPSADYKTIKKNLDAVEYWTKKDLDPIVKRMKTMTDLDRLYRKIQQGSIQATDLIHFDNTFKAAAWIASSEGLDTVLAKIQKVKDSVFKIFSIDKCYSASDDTSLFLPNIIPELDILESQIEAQHVGLNTWILERAQSISVSHDVFRAEFKEKSLIVKGPRSAIQALKSSGKLPVNVNAVVNKTGSYLESSELDKIFIIISRLRDSLKRKQVVALIEYGSELASNIFAEWFHVSEWIMSVDVNINLARVSVENGYVKPSILESATGSVEIEGLRHPLLEAQDRKIPYVQHNVSIGVKDQGWLLYGLNASGKSSLMRATGLAVLLAQGGSFVPARSMRLSPFTSLHTRIINTDNLWMGLSSFAVEMSEMRDIFREAQQKSLVLGDELCSGTETTSATALVAAGLRGLLNRGARFLFATHLHGLSKIEEICEDRRLNIWHLHVEYDRLQDKLIYHRTLKPGSGSSLYGLEVAKAMRIPDDILEDAIRFRKRLAGEAEISQSVGSAWNSSAIRIECEICHKTESANLEVHHIKERHTANSANRLSDGSDVHARSNLVVLCDSCHDGAHNGSITIGQIIQTSDGMERSVSTTTSAPTRNSKWSTEEFDTIRKTFAKFPKLSMSAISKYLLNQHDIKVSSITLKKLATNYEGTEVPGGPGGPAGPAGPIAP